MTPRQRDQHVALSVLFLLVQAAAAAQFDPDGSATARGHASSRKLQGANIFPLNVGVTANIAGVSIPLTLPLFGSIGAAAAESPKKFYRVNCDNPRPTFVVWPGMAGSQLDGTQTGGVANCPRITSPRQIYADISWLKNLPCFAHMLSVNYDHSTGRYSNSSGTQMWAYEGGFPDGTMALLPNTYWGNFFAHMESTYGYKRGVDFIMTPFDWRWDFDAHNQMGTFDQIAARIAAAVDQNCGQKAIILAHSLAPNLLLRMLREPRFQSWKQQHVKSIILVGATLAGAAATTWQARLSGVMDAMPALTNQIPAFKLAMLPVTPFDAAVYQMAMGMPAFSVLLPVADGLGRNHVLVKTPSREYTIGQQKELLREMGDEQSLALIDKIAAQNQANLVNGPVPGIDTYCIYGVGVDTPLTLEYGEPVSKQRVMRRPRNIIKGPGDGTVDLATLRLCNKVAPAANIFELTDSSIDHASVVQSQKAFEGMAPLFAKVGLIKGTPVQAAQRVDQPVSNRAAAQGSVVEERGKQG